MISQGQDDLDVILFVPEYTKKESSKLFLKANITLIFKPKM